MATLEAELVSVVDMDMETISYDDLHRRYAHTMQKVQKALENYSEYNLIMGCNQLVFEINKEIVMFHHFIRGKYRLQFPELESLVQNPIDYARVVKKIGSDMDLTLVDLQGLVQPATVMTVSFTALTTKGKLLPHDTLEKTIDVCDLALDLDAARKKVCYFVETNKGSIMESAGVSGLGMCTSRL
ncbi:unnamed protein product [Eruca vesicaria subsp. sativa]|uniref:NOSIC domain-containing protein n=1 Tax=Eruca vesicaria subsp. sativa TaxID=29727 RepID=A0ABC8IZV8_ERUVS|nr:unnamed protein product [Eruca vesicaria subsp. sativa]